jgi:hypothetical protein
MRRIGQRPEQNVRVDEDAGLLLECFKNIVRQGSVEIVGHAQNARQRAEPNARVSREGDKFRNGFTGSSNDDFLTRRCSIDESRQMGLCFM